MPRRAAEGCESSIEKENNHSDGSDLVFVGIDSILDVTSDRLIYIDESGKRKEWKMLPAVCGVVYHTLKHLGKVAGEVYSGTRCGR